MITDSIFEDFKSTIDPAKFKYDRVCETLLSTLREAAQTEGYMNDSVNEQLTRLEDLLRHDLNHDLDQNREAIDEFLSDEIIKRYYYQQGAVENMVRHDAAVDSAVRILSDPARVSQPPFSYWR